MEILIEQIATYGTVLLICTAIVWVYLKQNKKNSELVRKKVESAKEEGLFEPVSLYPHIDLSTCIGSAACVVECPEKDILGIVDDKATVINTTECVGHGACFHACPVEAITLRIGTETRGVDLPHVNQSFETNMKGVYIAGELGGMGLIKNSVEQGYQAVRNIAKIRKPVIEGVLDLVVVGAGPAGISATLEAKRLNLSCITIEQESLGGTVYTYPRAKIVMTQPMDLPLVGKVKLKTTNKDELISLWEKAISDNDLQITENTKVESILPVKDGVFKIQTSDGKEHLTHSVLLATGRRGSPRKLECPGEELPKVFYRLLDSETITNQDILVVGGGDSAIESALLLKDRNRVTLSYRRDKFSRLKPKNREKILEAIEDGSIQCLYNSNVVAINWDQVLIKAEENSKYIPNDLVYIFAGGELPSGFLRNVGIEITKRFNYIMKQHV